MMLNRKKNLSSKIIVDEYDHLILNSKIKPSFQPFAQTHPQFNQGIQYKQSKYQSQQSEYSMIKERQVQIQRQNQIMCKRCGENFPKRIYESHANICEKRTCNVENKQNQTKLRNQNDTLKFRKKNQYNFLSMNESGQEQNLMVSGRTKVQKKISNGKNKLNQNSKNNSKFLSSNEIGESRLFGQMIKSNSKKSIHSQSKQQSKRPTSSTRNKVELKEYQNLKQKILHKLEDTRKSKNTTQHVKQQSTPNYISSSLKRNITSGSRPKSIPKHLPAQKQGHLISSKYSTINASGNKRQSTNIQQQYKKTQMVNRSQIMQGNHYNSTRGIVQMKRQREIQKGQHIKEEKKLKKRNINFNGSFVSTNHQQKERQMEKQYKPAQNKKKNVKQEQRHVTQNSSYLGDDRDHLDSRNFSKKFQDKEFIRHQLKKQGVFRRQSSSSASNRKFNRRQFQRSPQNMQEKPNPLQQVNDQYYFFQNHPSSVPSHIIRRPQQPLTRDENHERDIYEANSSNILRNKLGINKNLIHSKQVGKNGNIQTEHQIKPERRIQQELSQHPEFYRKRQNQNASLHHRTTSNRENVGNQRRNEQYNLEDIRTQNTNQKRKPEIFTRNMRNQELIPQRSQNPQNRHRPQNQQRHEIQQRAQNQPRGQNRQRPENPMGQQRQSNIKRGQNMNRVPQNRLEPRITNQRMNIPNQGHRVNSQNQNPLNHQANSRNVNPSSTQQRRNRRQPGSSTQQQRRRQNQQPGLSRRQTNQRQSRQNNPTNPNRRMRNQTLNFISNTLNQQFQVMNGHFNLLNNIFSNFNNFVNVNITATNGSENTFVFRNGRRQHQNNQPYGEENSQDNTHSQYSDFSSDFSQDDDSFDDDTDYDEQEYIFEEDDEQNPGMTEHEISSIPVLRYNKDKHGNNQCTICLVELNHNEPFKKLFCEHVFHQECIDEWLKRKNACPVCRDQMGVS